MPADFKDELQAIRNFIAETQAAPENFHSFHWVISTEGRWRFGHSSAIVGGPFDISEAASKPAPFSFVYDALTRMLSMPYIYAADIPLPSKSIDARDIMDMFAGGAPDRVLTVLANGRRLSEAAGWAVKLILVGFYRPAASVATGNFWAASKPLVGSTLHSQRTSPQ